MKQGKTTLALHLAKQDHQGVVAWDPRCMIDGIICYGPESLQEAINQKSYKNGTLVYRFDSEDVDGEFSSLCSVLFPPRFTLEKFSLVIDEAGELQRSNSIHPSLDRAVRQHPRSVTIIQTSHSLQDWARSSRDLVTDLYCFALVGRSLESVVKFCDGDDEMMATIKSLPPHHYLHWDHATASWSICDKPNSWFEPLKQSPSEPSEPIPICKTRSAERLMNLQ